MLSKSDVWTLQDAKARFSEVVRRAKAGEPQRVTLHGKEAVAVVDTSRFNISPKPGRPKTLAGFVEASKKYRGLAEDIDFESSFPMVIDPHNSVFDEDEK
jgi:prevent-host-death family protein